MRMGALVAGGLCLALAPVVHWLVSREAAAARAVLDTWMTVPATITWSQLEELGPLEQAVADKKYVGRVGFADTSPSGTRYWLAQIRYEYSRGGTMVESDRVTLHPERRKKQCEQLVAAYPYQARVNAWVNPEDFDDVVLAPETGLADLRKALRWPWILVAFGTLSILVGLGIVGQGAKETPPEITVTIPG